MARHYRTVARSVHPFRKSLVLVVALTLVASTLTAGLVSSVTQAPAAAAGVPRNGLTSQTASPSCWAIKQSYPTSPDGIYWLWTPTLVQPQQFYCDMTTDGGGWVLIGRGREGWSFPYWGQGSPAAIRNTITGTAAFDPAALPTPTVNGLLNGGRMDALTDGIRLRRATNTAGSTWQEVRMRVKTYGSWSWAFGGGIFLSSIKFDNTTTNFSNSVYRTNTTANTQVANDTRRVWTWPDATTHGGTAGFSFGSNTNGSTAATSYLWQYSGQSGNAIPFTQVFVRPQISEASIAAAGASFAPDTGLPASSVPALLDRQPSNGPWAFTDINMGAAIPDLMVAVKGIAQIGNTIYMGGKFRNVQRGVGGPKYAQSYLAAFDKDTGEWIPSFNPVIDAPVLSLKASPDGTKLFVGGEFTNVNGVAGTTGLAALDPTTGAPVSGWTGYVSRPTGSYDVRAMDVQGPWLYIGGNFTRVSGGATDFVGPLNNAARLARLRLTDGRPDWNWLPGVNTAPWDVNVSKQGDRVYAIGAFTTLNGATLATPKLAVVDTVTGAAVPGLQGWQQDAPTSAEPSLAVLEVGDKVYQGGSQHYLHQYNRATYGLERSHETRQGGDYQALAYKDGILYGASHGDNWQYEDTNTWPDPAGYSQVNPYNLIGAYDTNNNLEVVPEFQPARIRQAGAGGTGPYALTFDTNGCMWAGGDILVDGAPSSPYYGGYARFCPRDTTPPATPPNAKASVAGNTVTLSWNPSTDNSTDALQYEILKDDPTFGTIVAGTTYDRNWTDTNVVGTTRYFVRALDSTGNRSATTATITVSPPPPVLASIVAHGASWSYRADGQNLGTAWRQPGFDSSSWPTGNTQLGWGGKGEDTTIPSGPITSYFVKHVNVSDPSSYKTLTVRLKRDDGAAVYINGVEVVRDNLPAGALSASTPASSYTSGPTESTWFEYSVPASLLTAGDNTIAVELHQADANNADGIFDLELQARGGSEAVAPSAPTLTTGTAGFSTVPLSWTAATDDTLVIGYLLRRNGVPILFTPGTSFTDTGLTPTTAYAYDVVAVDSSGNVSAPATANATTLANPALVKSGDVWSYKSDGTDPGTAWRQPGFNASSWASGPSQLGWGGRGETTVVPSGQLAQYFVRHFTVDDASQDQALTLRLKRDDGAAVYINGTEVVRSNLPTGPLTAASYSSTKVTAADGVTWYQFTVPGDLLVSGDNVIAAELHQDAKSDTRAVFDLELVRATPAETNPPTRPALTLTGTTETSIAFSWTAATDDAGILGYSVRRNGAVVGFTTSTSFTDTGLAPNTPYGYQVTAIDTSGNPSTPGSLAAATVGSVALLSSGAVWSYLADGSNQGTAWRQPGFDASAWPTGASQLGWGGRGETTVLPSGTITQYFVKHITVADPNAIPSLTLRLKRDDGAAVYVNGNEVARSNLPAGTLTSATYPTTKVTAADGVTWYEFTIPTATLVAGDNVIAAELHQDAKSDTRAVFDLELRSTVSSATPVVTLNVPANNGYVKTTSTTLSGLCTTSAGTVTVNLSGAQTSILTTPCVANEWNVVTPLGDGGYAAVASQTDSGTGLVGTSASSSFTVDTVAPVVTLDSPTAGVTLGAATPTFAGQCSTADGNVKVAITGAAAQTVTTACSAGTYSVASNALPTGTFSATASQTDAAGNVGASSATSFGIDITAPVTTDDSASFGSAWRSSAVTVTLSPTDAGVGVATTYYTTDGSTPTTASATGTSIPLTSEGVYTIKYFSVDGLGNTEAVKTAAAQIRIDQTAPVTTDNTASIGSNWKNANQTVTLAPTDGGGGVSATYYTTDGSTPTTASAKGTSIALTASGTYTIRYFSVDAAGNAEAVQTAPTPIRIDKSLPVTTDNTASIGNSWKTAAQTVTLTPTDTGGSGVAATYYTTDGSTPTTSSAQGTSITLTSSGSYTIKYFSVDAAGNTEAVKTAGTAIRIDTTAPTNTITFPANGASYNSTRWSSGGCSSSNRICGTAADSNAGLSNVTVTVLRQSDGRYWNGSTWVTSSSSVTATGTTSWYISFSTSALTNGTTYTVSARALDAAGNSTTTTSVFTYDTTAPASSSVAVTNKSGTVQTSVDTFAVTFAEAINPSTVPATATLTIQRARSGNTTYGISGLTSGQLSTGNTGYLTQPPNNSTTYTVTYAGTLTLSNGNKTVTFTVTGACAGSCSSLSSSAVSGAFTFTPNTALQDPAGNAATGTITASSQVMF
jgi:hypothetical protein